MIQFLLLDFLTGFLELYVHCWISILISCRKRLEEKTPLYLRPINWAKFMTDIF